LKSKEAFEMMLEKQNTTKRQAFSNLIADNKDQWSISKSYTAPHMINDSNGWPQLAASSGIISLQLRTHQGARE
jgi:hypothetical protein